MATSAGHKVVGWDSPVLIHPGEHLLDFIEETGITQTELAARVGISKKAINEIVKGKAPITQNTAFRLSKVFSVSPEFWINLQNNYDLALARVSEEERLREDADTYAEQFKETYQELSKRGFLPACKWVQGNVIHVTKNLQKFFAVDSLQYVGSGTMDFAFRKYYRDHLNQNTLAAWVQLGKIQAKLIESKPFDREKLKKDLPKIRALSCGSWSEYIPQLEKTLADCGVVLIFAPRLKHAPIQGATHWVESDKVLVMLNADNQYEDRFWFSLFHELGHVLLHGKKDVYVDFDKGGEKTKEEQEADEFAQKWLIPDIKELYQLLNQRDLSTAVKSFAKENNISPAIVAGRLTHEHATKVPKIYALMNPFLEERIHYSNLTFGEQPEVILAE